MHLIYLDNNASTPVDPVVAEAMKPYLTEIFGNPSSSHPYGSQAKQAIEKARKQVAQMINAHPDEIVFTSGGTESNNYAIKGIALVNRYKGNHILTSAVEHPSVLEVCRYLEKHGFLITLLPVNSEGCVIVSEVEKYITPSTILISVMHANNETGAIQPVNEIGTIARKHRIPFHTDAAQSCGKIRVDVEEMKADLLTIAGHKLYAPKGIGALYIRRGIQLEKLIHGADHEQNLRAGTENVASVVGLGKAAELAVEYTRESPDPHPFKRDTSALRDLLFTSLQSEIPEMLMNGPVEGRLPNTLSVSFPGIEAGQLLSNMPEIAASAGAACHAGSVTVSSVLQAMKIPEFHAMGTIRFSLGRTTTKEEITAAVPMIVKAFRKLSGNEEIKNFHPEGEEIKLTHYSPSLGCACKIEPLVLEKLLQDLPGVADPQIMVGLGTSDDAVVYQINEHYAIVQTVDFIPPVVDDPYHFGAIAAANALSDVYAMGGTPLFALGLVGFPLSHLPVEILQMIIRGAADKVSEAGISIAGGHSVKDAEPKFGLVVTGKIHPEKILKNSTARNGDTIILTKPIGTGILSAGIKRGLVRDKDKTQMIRLVEQLNKYAAEVMNEFPVSACTDVTGFGLLGHLKEMVTGSRTGAVIGLENIPLLPGVWELATANVIPGSTLSNLQFSDKITQWESGIPEAGKKILADAQTSGGLLISVPRECSTELLTRLRAAGAVDSSIIGYFSEKVNVIRVVGKLPSQ